MPTWRWRPTTWPRSGVVSRSWKGAACWPIWPCRFEDVHAALLPLRAAARSLGVTLAEPFLQVAFLPLPVIPHLKISDRGMVDVDRMELIA